LDYCFRKLALTKKELLSFVNKKLEQAYDGEQIQLRQLDTDLNIFRRKKEGFNAPLPSNVRTYNYSNPNFSIAQRPLLPYEEYLVDATSRLLERFENQPKYDRLAEALIKFQDEEEQDNETSKILYYDLNEEYKGIRFLKPLYLSIKKKQALQITYKGFNDQLPSYFEFHPHILKQYNRRWFVYGYNKTNNVSAWSIPLDERLVKFEFLEDIDYIKANTDWDVFFRTMVGVVRPLGAQVQKVVLRFYNGRENYFKTKPFVPDFDIPLALEKQNEVFFHALVNRELVQQILSYGKDVEVLAPPSLIAEMKEHITLLKNYY
jgi:predicted DNA-binding transcriptional regulator YafY